MIKTLQERNLLYSRVRSRIATVNIVTSQQATYKRSAGDVAQAGGTALSHEQVYTRVRVSIRVLIRAEPVAVSLPAVVRVPAQTSRKEGICQIKICHLHMYCMVFTTSKTGVAAHNNTSLRSTYALYGLVGMLAGRALLLDHACHSRMSCSPRERA